MDGWTPIYPHLGVINVNGLAGVGACEWPPASLSHDPRRPLPVYLTPAHYLAALALVAPTGWCALIQLRGIFLQNRKSNEIQEDTRNVRDYSGSVPKERRLIPEGIIIVLHSCTGIKTKGRGTGPPRCWPYRPDQSLTTRIPLRQKVANESDRVFSLGREEITCVVLPLYNLRHSVIAPRGSL